MGSIDNTVFCAMRQLQRQQTAPAGRLIVRLHVLRLEDATIAGPAGWRFSTAAHTAAWFHYPTPIR